MTSFTVEGLPKVKGNWTSVPHPTKPGRRVMIPSNKTAKSWEEHVRLQARCSHSGPPIAGPVSVSIAFYLPRAKKHFSTSRNHPDRLVPSAPAAPVSHNDGDIDKLARAVLDACEGEVYGNDAQVVRLQVWKAYESREHGVKPGVCVAVAPVDPGPCPVIF